MSTSQEAFVTPEVVRWARERTGVSIGKLANQINVKASSLEAWEDGEKRPTFRQAENLARILSIPFGYLFLSEPPTTTTTIPDLRTVGGHVTDNASPEFLDQLNDVLLKQRWYRAYLDEEHGERLAFVRSFSLESKPVDVAVNIASRLAIDDGLREESSGQGDFFRKIVHKAEDIGVLIFRSGVAAANNRRKLKIEEFRGFAISDEFAPAVFINSRDAQSAQLFTLVHELAHIWIGSTGISNTDFTESSARQTNRTERFCNQVAAEALVPSESFLQIWDDDEVIERNIANVSTYFRVSGLVALRRAYDYELLTADDYVPRVERELRQRPKGKEGGDYYATLRARNSDLLTNTVVREALEGRILLRDAARLLNIKVPTIEKVSDWLVKRKHA